MTLILRGTADTIPADVLTAHIRAARSGQQRLVIVDEGTRFGWMIVALLQECAGRFAARQSTMPRVSICRWFAGDARTILFIAAGAGVDDGACRSVAAAIARITEIERGGGRSIAVLAYDDGEPCGASEADLQPAIYRKTGNEAASGRIEAAGGAQ